MNPGDKLDHEVEALRFLQALETNADLAHECQLTDLAGRLSIANREAYRFSESDLRVVVRNWDYYGTWLKWLHDGRLAATLDDLPELADHYPLSDEKIASFREHGHVLLPSVLSQDEVDAYRPVFRSCAATYNPENRPVSDREFKSFLLLVNLRTRDERIARLALGHRFGQIAAELLGVPQVRLYLDEGMVKEKDGGTTHWHQDNLYFPFDTDNTVTMWLPLVDLTASMGTLHFASGSHRDGDLGYQPISEEAESYFAQFIVERGYQYTPGADMIAGDATFHHGWVLHGAPPNMEERAREVYALVYYPSDSRLSDPQNLYQERAMNFGFKARPGDPARSPIHPIV
jgi:ectoine hydroxylase-related dioxygenase (phytanoyl-CoA dioxygenase family)